MFPFSFQKEIIQQSPPQLDEITLIQHLFMTILENQRLHQELANHQSSQDVSFSLEKKGDFNREQEYKLQIELKQVKIDNLTSMLKELQLQILNSDKQFQEITHKNAMLELSSRQEITEIRSQMSYYKTKYQEQANGSKKYFKLQSDYKAMKSEFQNKSKELTSRNNQIQNELLKIEKNREVNSFDNQKRTKQLRNTIETLRNDLSLKEQECFSLKTSLDDCPKLQELNRWICKVKEYEERQLQACSKMSQMSQQLCVARQRYRKLESEYRQLQKIKQQLQSAITENKGHEDSMVIYFDRLQTYQKVIKQLEEQIKKLQAERRNKDKQQQAKVDSLEKQKESVITQWKNIVEEMDKQRVIMISMQKEVEKYQKYISEQNDRQNEMWKNEQSNQLALQRRIAEEQRSRVQEMSIQPYSFIQSSKCSEKSNRSLSLQNKKNDFKSSQIETEPSNALQSQVTSESSRQLRANSSMIGRATSQQRLVYHSDPQSRNSTSRLNTQMSNGSRETGCGQCISRIQQNRYEYSNRSSGIQQTRNLRNEECRAEMSQITDEKKLLMQKLNILKPQDPNLSIRGGDRNISNLYSKSYRQVNPSSQSFLKLNAAQNSSKQLSYQTSNANRLQLGRGRLPQEKQNLNDMIVKRYTNMMHRP